LKKELHTSVAGVRGIWGVSLFPETALHFSKAFGSYLRGGKVVIGRDTRTTSELLSLAAVLGLISSGCEVIDIGVCPTPTCQLSVQMFQADGGLIITASHNPEEWNGLKFVNREGEFLSPDEHETFMRISDQDTVGLVDVYHVKPFNETVEFHQKAIETHIHKISRHVDVNNIRRRQFHVVLDAVNGAGSQLLIPLLKHFACRTHELNCQENGLFTRGPEPRGENLSELCKLVKRENADIGVAVDPDGDRLSLVTEKGDALGEELTLPLVAQHILRKFGSGGVVVTNLSTSMAIDTVADRYGAKVIRTKIGEAHVVSAMKKNNCIVGGEGNGGVIVPEVQYARDSGVGIGIVLDSLTETEQTLSELAREVPQYFMIKKKLVCDQNKIPELLDSLAKLDSDAEIDRTDGVKIVWKDRWVHIRKSGTEGLLRVFAETTTIKEAERMVDSTIKKIESIINP
jgi:phosphomannomutase